MLISNKELKELYMDGATVKCLADKANVDEEAIQNLVSTYQWKEERERMIIMHNEAQLEAVRCEIAADESKIIKTQADVLKKLISKLEDMTDNVETAKDVDVLVNALNKVADIHTKLLAKKPASTQTFHLHMHQDNPDRRAKATTVNISNEDILPL